MPPLSGPAVAAARHGRGRVPCLLLALCAGATLAFTAVAHGSGAKVVHQRAVIVFEQVRSAGTYNVTVVVSTRAKAPTPVKLTLGNYASNKRRSVTVSRRSLAKVSVRLALKGGFSVSATGWRSRPSLKVTISRLTSAGSVGPAPTTAQQPALTGPPVGSPIVPAPAPTAIPVLAYGQSWVPSNGVSFTPLSDAAAAALVTPSPEIRPTNAASNAYMPTSAQLQAFYSATDNTGVTVVQADPYYRFVTGHYTGTTDEIIQWAALKWGIPIDWLRSECVQESWYYQSQLGDAIEVSPTVYAEYPPQARIPGTDQVYETMGLGQIKWAPDGSVGAGTEPLRWESSAFSVDYLAATIRFYFDNPGGLRSTWGDSTYQAGQQWNSMGGWFEPYPWGNDGQESYIADVQGRLSDRTWAQSNF